MSRRMRALIAALVIAQLPVVGFGATSVSALPSPATECDATVDPAPGDPSAAGFGSIAGTVGYAGTETLPNALVQATPAGGGTTVSQYTDVDGNYRFVGLAEGDWVISADTNPTTGTQYYCDTTDGISAQPIAITPTEADWIGVNVLFQQPGRIEGSVKLGDDPVTVDTNTYFVSAEPQAGGAPIGTQLQADGTYRFDNVADGTYVVWVTRMGMTGQLTRYHPGANDRMNAGAVTIDETTRIQSGIDIGLPDNRIEGQITSGPGPVIGAAITAYPGPDYWIPGPTTTTDGNGDYTLRGLGDGDYRLAVTPADQTTGRFLGGGTSPYSGTIVTVSEQSNPISTGRNIDLPGGGFTGTLTDGTDVVANRTLTFRATSYDPMMGSQFVDTATTNDQGEFTVEYLPSGSYAVTVNDPVGSSSIAIPGTFTTGTTVTPIAPLLPVGSITGFGYRNDAVIDGMTTYTTVYLDPVPTGGTGTPPPQRSTQLDSNGRYTFSNVADGNYYVSMQVGAGGRTYHPSAGSTATASVVTLSPSDRARSGIDITVPTGSISGAVTSSGSILTTASGWVNLIEVGSMGSQRGTSLTNGTYSFGEVADGQYIVSVNLSGTMANLYHPSGSTLAGATTLTVGAGSRTYTDVNVAVPAGRIAGTVTEGELGVSSGTVQVYDSTYTQRGSSSVVDGVFSIGNLPNGSYRVAYSPQSGGQTWNGGSDFSSATQIVISDLQPERLDVAIELPTGVIEGDVRDGENPPTGYTTVELISTAPTPPGAFPTSRSVVVQPDGSFRFGNVADGSYRLRYNQVTGGSGFHPGGTTQANATIFTIEATNRTISDVLLELPSGLITGVVARGVEALDGTTGSTQVTLSTVDGTSSRTAQVSGSGVYEFTKVPDGAYVVSYTQWAPYLQVFHLGATTRADAVVVEVAEGNRERSGINIALPDGTISGRISAPDVPGVQSATVQAFGPNNSLVGTTTSTGDGGYTITGLPDGVYRVAVTPPSSIGQTWWNGSNFANAGQIALAGTANDEIDVDIALPGGELSGVLYDGGQPAAFRTIGIESGTGSGRVNVITGENGGFSFRYLRAGTYRLSIQVGFDTVTLPGSYVSDGINIVSNLVVDIPQGSIGGDVTRGGLALPFGQSVQVSLEPFPSVAGSSTRTTQVSAGRYQFDNVADGTYRVRFSSWTTNVSGYAPGVSGVDGAEIVEISAAVPQRDDVDIALPNASISGQVTLGGGALPAGAAYSVSAELDGTLFPGGGSTTGTTVGPGGTYTIGGLWPGTYRVKVTSNPGFPPSSASVTAYHLAAGNAFDADLVTIAGLDDTVENVNVDITAGTVSGFVTRGGERVNGFERGVTVQLVEPLTSTTRQVQVDEDGNFSFSPVGDGDYTLSYAEQTTGATGAHPVGTDARSATVVTVSPSTRSVNGIEFQLPSIGAVEGFVTDANGIGFATTVSLRLRPGPFSGFGPTVRTLESASNGFFRFEAVAVGEYTVSVQTPSDDPSGTTTVYAPETVASADAEYVEVTAGATAQISVQEPGTFTIEGEVRNGDGQLVDGVGVYVIDQINAISPSGRLVATTGPNGAYTSSELLRREYVVKFEPPAASGYLPTFHGAPSYNAATIIDPAPGVTLVDNVDGLVGPAGTISGTIRDSNGDAVDAWVELFPVGARRPYEFGVPVDSPRQQAAPGGAYSFGQLPAGDWLIRAQAVPASGLTAQAVSAPTYSGNTLDRSAATPVVLGAGASVVADVQVVVGQTIRGTVTDPGGNPVIGVTVSTNSVTPFDPFFISRSTSTGSDGRYELVGLVPGDEIQLAVYGSGTPALVSSYYDGAYTPGDAQTFAVPAIGTIPDIDFQLARGISGTAVTIDSSGDVTANRFVGAVVCPSPAVPVGPYGCSDNALSSFGQRGDDGSLYFSALAPGTYKVAARANGPSAAVATLVIAEGDTFSCILPLTRAGGDAICTARPIDATASVSGTVYGADGAPLPGAQVTLHAGRNALVAGAITDADGGYIVSSVPAGAYRIGVAGQPPLLNMNRPLISEWYHPSGTVYQDSTTGLVQGNYEAGEVVTVGDGVGIVLDDVQLEEYPRGSATVTGGPAPTGSSTVIALCPAPYEPVAGSSACLDPTTGQSLGYSTSLFQQDGVFSTDFVLPGTYNVAGRTQVPGDVNSVLFTEMATLVLAGSQEFSCELPLIGTAGAASCTAADIEFTPPDTDGVSDEVENGAPNGGDGDGDGNLDSQQSNVASLVDTSQVPSGEAPPPESYITLKSTTSVIGTTAPAPLVEVTATPLAGLPTQPPSTGTYSTALLSFAADYRPTPDTPVDTQNPITATFEVYLPSQANRYWKYDSSAASGEEWIDATSLVVFDTEATDISSDGSGIMRWKATISIVDGGFGDDDGVVNGVVVDPAIFDYAPFEFSDFQRPVQAGELNTAKAGRAIPLKFQVFQGGVEITDPTQVEIAVQRLDCQWLQGMGEAAVEYTFVGGSQLRYADGKFQSNWKTPSTPGCFKVSARGVDVDGSVSIHVTTE